MARRSRGREATQEQDPPAEPDQPDTGMEGGPGAEPQGGEVAFRFQYNGRTFEKESDLDAYIRDLDSRANRPAPAAPAQPASTPSAAARRYAEEVVDWDKEFFQNPRQAMKKYREEVVKEVSDNLRTEYQQENALRQFWTDFYTENKDLVGKERLATMMFSEHLDELAPLRPKEARQKLAERTRSQLSEWGAQAPPTRHRTAVEGSTAPSQRRPAAEGGPPREGYRSLSSILKARQQARSGKHRTQTA